MVDNISECSVMADNRITKLNKKNNHRDLRAGSLDQWWLLPHGAHGRYNVHGRAVSMILNHMRLLGPASCYVPVIGFPAWSRNALLRMCMNVKHLAVGMLAAKAAT